MGAKLPKWLTDLLGLSIDEARNIILTKTKGAQETSYNISFVKKGWVYTADFENGKVREVGKNKFNA